jgi:hypothetical protein
MRFSRQFIATVAIVSAQSGCFGSSEKATDRPGRCVDVAATLADRIMQQHAIASLPDDIQEDLAKSLESTGRVCLSAPSQTMSCNSGGARAPQVGSCCRFTRPPEGILSGLPAKLHIGREAEAPAVDLELSSTLADLALDQRCQVPTCADDRATARPQVVVAGHIVSATGSTDIEIILDLAVVLDLTCASESAEATG